ncbi:hypothetical protein WJX73_010186 [Symbiochloris irregularis]|uniref:Calponin-homology (CH) domain-containing protein n=1 Tax=Symbiochloris irregularis TaxID=706552 RepID=A0AAW1PK40_9CHLO
MALQSRSAAPRALQAHNNQTRLPEAHAVLQLTAPSEASWLEFGRVQKGCCVDRQIAFVNTLPQPTVLSLSGLDQSCIRVLHGKELLCAPLLIAAHASEVVTVTWTAQKAGQLNQLLEFQSDRHEDPFQVILHGTAIGTPSAQPVKASRPNGSTPSIARKGERCTEVSPHGLHQPRLVESGSHAQKASQVAKGHQHGSGHVWAQSSILHDRTLLEQQEQGFVCWLNYHLAPQAGANHASLAVGRNVAAVRGCLWRLYCQDQGVARVVTSLEQYIDNGFLAIQEPEAVLRDVRLQAVALKSLCFYHPFWLRLGLEVVLGRHIKQQQDQAQPQGRRQQEKFLHAFMAQHFLGDASLQREHTFNPTSKGLQTHAYWEGLGRLVLKRVLLLVLLLDRAADKLLCGQAGLQLPLLLRTDGTVKSSSQMVASILQEWLHRDVLRQLGAKGYRLTHTQDPRTELDLTVKTLSLDLRSGLRLCRLTELLAGVAGVLASAVVPSERRPMQMHNTQLALQQASASAACNLTVQAADFVDGDRMRTLAALWELFCALQLPCLLDEHTLASETARICKGSTVSTQDLPAAPAVHSTGSVVARHCDLADGRLLCLLVAHYLPWFLPLEDIWAPSKSLLWPEGDGKAETEAGWLRELRARDAGQEDALQAYQQGRQMQWRLRHRRLPGFARKHLHKWIAAAQVVQRAARAWHFRRGLRSARAVRPRMLHSTVQLQALWRARAPRRAFLGARNAAIIIQACVRGRQARVGCHNRFVIQPLLQRCTQEHARLARQRRLKCLNAAAAVIQRQWRALHARRSLLAARQAAVAIQAAVRRRQAMKAFRRQLQSLIWMQLRWRGKRARRLFAMQKAALVIQTLWRRRGSMLALSRARAAVLSIQAFWRGFVVRARLHGQRQAAVILQARRYIAAQSACLRLQAWWRMLSQRRRFWKLLEQHRQHAAAIVVQARWRGRKQRLTLSLQRRCAVVIQSRWRGHRACTRYQSMQAAALVLQTLRRAACARRLLRQHRAAQAIQKNWRMWQAQMHYAHMQSAAVIVQASVRGWRARQRYLAALSSAIAMQAAFRGHRTRRRYQQVRSAAITLQSHWRGRACRADLARRQAAALRIQTHFRMAAIVVQAHARGYLYRQQLRRAHAAAVRLQAAWRAAQGRRSFIRLRGAAVQIQARVRGAAARSSFLQHKAAAICIQAHWRGMQARQMHQRIVAALAIQRFTKGWLVRRRLARQAAAATCIQAAVRMHILHKRYVAMLQMRSALRHLARTARRARVRLRRLRAAALIIQRGWRQRLARVNAAATVVQAHVRSWLACRQYRAAQAAAVCIQARWRGAHARMVAGAPFQRRRERLSHVASACASQRHLWLSTRTAAALRTLRGASQVNQAGCACHELLTILTDILGLLLVLMGDRRWGSSIASEPGCLDMLAAQMQAFREQEDVFMAAVAVFAAMCKHPAAVAEMQGQQSPVMQMRAVCQLLARKADTERKYLARLEGEKGSDASAREATRRMLAAVQTEQWDSETPQKAAGSYRNTLVHAPAETVYKDSRAQFAFFNPALGNPIFAENAGGSQVPTVVAEAVADHLLHNNAQLGAGYSVSNRSTQTVEDAHAVVEALMGAGHKGKVILGASTSQLMQNLADSYRRAKAISAEDEIIIHEAGHEANTGPWVRLAEETGAQLKVWKVRPEVPFSSSIEDLEALLSPRTRVVAMVHVSNVLGAVQDVGRIQRAVRKAGRAHLVVDGVAYAPHLPMDVSGWDVDWYVFSTYKTFGPHMAALYGRHEAIDTVKSGGPNHYFVPLSDPVYKFELGSASHEGCAGLIALGHYLQHMAGEQKQGGLLQRATVEAAFEKFAAMEAPLQERLVSYLISKPSVAVIGPTHGRVGLRVPTISFIVQGQKSAEVASTLHAHNIGCRNGHAYAFRLLTALNRINPDWDINDGVVRVSLLHYNTPAEVETIIAALEEILS